MLQSFYLDLMDHIHTGRASLDMVQKKFELLKDDFIQKARDEQETKQVYLDKIEMPRQEYDARYQTFMEESKKLRKTFYKNNNQGSLEGWLNHYNMTMNEFNNMSKSPIYTSKIDK